MISVSAQYPRNIPGDTCGPSVDVLSPVLLGVTLHPNINSASSVGF